MKAILFITFLSLLTTSTFGLTAGDLFDSCRNVELYTDGSPYNTADINMCMGYVSGVYEEYLDFMIWANNKEASCYYKTYPNLTPIQMSRVFYKYIKNHPEYESTYAPPIVIQSLDANFPMPKECEKLK